MAAQKKPVLGVVGGIGSGKSKVAAELVKHGGFLIQGDQLGHEALRQPEILGQVAAKFGKEILDEQGHVDRRKLGARVFADAGDLRALESLVFPFIGKRIEEEIARARQQAGVRFIVLDAAVMLESGWGRRCDKVIFVDVPRALRLKRIAEQRGWSEKEVASREQAQMDLSLKKQRADIVVDNAQGLEELSNQARKLLEKLGLAATLA